jgi:hypothetical protein
MKISALTAYYVIPIFSPSACPFKYLVWVQANMPIQKHQTRFYMKQI